MGILSVTYTVKHKAKSILRRGVRVVVAFSWSRAILNTVYIQLTLSWKGCFYEAFAKIFRNTDIRVSDGYWKVAFADRTLRLPLTSERFWLDWEIALSVLGHDVEVKRTYEALLGTPSEKPELFVDIGANYGTHSLLFLVHGVETITLEPNTSCHEYFIETCMLNHVLPRLEPVALGEREGVAELSYPKDDTLLGSTNTELVKGLSSNREIVAEEVEQRTIDDYFPQIRGRRTLIKIDTEGNELFVLRGGIKTLRQTAPTIIFESWADRYRSKIFEILSSLDYSIYDLPWSPVFTAEPLTFNEFMSSSSHNFIALPTSNEVYE